MSLFYSSARYFSLSLLKKDCIVSCAKAKEWVRKVRIFWVKLHPEKIHLIDLVRKRNEQWIALWFLVRGCGQWFVRKRTITSSLIMVLQKVDSNRKETNLTVIVCDWDVDVGRLRVSLRKEMHWYGWNSPCKKYSALKQVPLSNQFLTCFFYCRLTTQP